ncbi:hypothetical protein [Hymenobacter psychrophilus]|nr:hypothetical protein [Hymenobacter psychrophilus]
MRLQQYLRNPTNKVTAPHAAHYPDLDLWRPLIPVSVFVLSVLLIVAFDLPWISRFSLLLVWPLMWRYNRRYQRLTREYNA